MSTRRKSPSPEVTVTLEDGTNIAPDEETARRALAERRPAQERGKRRRELWGDGTSAERMQRLCARFAALEQVEGAGVGLWDANRVLAWACEPISHGERLAALFVLRVWNSGTDWNEIAHLSGDDGEPPLLEEGQTLGAFDVMEAWTVWDLEQRYAALTWLQDPFWP